MAARTAVVLAPGVGVQVRCHTDCPWIDGFVLDSFADDGELRVRRRGERRSLPLVVAAQDVRPAPASAA